MKICKRCNIEKPLSNFCKRKDTKDGLHRYCKECSYKIGSNYYHLTGKITRKEYYKQYREENKEYFNKYVNEHYHNNKEYYRQWNRDKMNSDPLFRLRHAINALINHHLKENKSKHTIEYLGCTIQEYKKYLEPMLTQEMNWNNYGSYWEIDHIHPLSKGGIFHYTNTQPLTINENRIKSNSLI